MNALVKNLTKFIENVLQLYAPLPFELTADLHTLNAFLRSYSEVEEKLLEGFVNRLTEKLEQKKKQNSSKDILLTNNSEQFDHILKHYSSCNFRYPQLKLNLEESNSELNATCNLLQENQERHPFSQRGRGDEKGIKSQRHKFGSKARMQKIKEMGKQFDKQNLSLVLNSGKDSRTKELKCIKSQAEFLKPLDSNKMHENVKIRETGCLDKKGEKSKNKIRYESNDSKNSNTSSLKIKLKPRPFNDLVKIKQGLQQVLDLFEKQDQQIRIFMEKEDAGQESY